MQINSGDSPLMPASQRKAARASAPPGTAFAEGQASSRPALPAMSLSTSSFASEPDAIAASLARVAPQVLRLADGDPAFAAQIRSMMWGEYRDAGAPMGHSESGMMVWWDEQMAAYAE